MRLKRKDIDALAAQFVQWAIEYDMGGKWSLFCNGRRLSYTHPARDDWYCFSKVEQDVSPTDYSEYFSRKFILGVEYAYDSPVAMCIKGLGFRKARAELENMLADADLYLTRCDDTHFEATWNGNGDIDDAVEYSYYKNGYEES